MSLVTRARHDPGTALWVVAGAAWLLLIVPALAGLPRRPPPRRGRCAAVRDPAGAGGAGGVRRILAGDGVGDGAAHHGADGADVPHRQRGPGAAEQCPGGVLGGILRHLAGLAAVALLADLAVHAMVEGWAWLAAHDGLVLAGALALAGGVQFTALKQRCLTLCRDPRAMLFRHYRRGAPAAWALGARHGLSCSAAAGR